MRTIDYTDDEGLVQRSLVPEGASDEEAPLGVPVGVDIVDGLTRGGMPYETAKRLQNELRLRGVWGYKNVRKRSAEEIFAALQAAFRIDVAAVINLLKEAQDG